MRVFLHCPESVNKELLTLHSASLRSSVRILPSDSSSRSRPVRLYESTVVTWQRRSLLQRLHAARGLVTMTTSRLSWHRRQRRLCWL